MEDAPVGVAVEPEQAQQDPPAAPEYVSNSVPDGELPTRPENDKVPYVALLFVALGYLPPTVYERVIGFGYFGPLQVPAILAMVAVLFAVIGVLRAVDWKDRKTLRLSVLAGSVALVRLFLVPLL